AAAAASVAALIDPCRRDFLFNSEYQLHPKPATKSENARMYNFCSSTFAGLIAARLPELPNRLLMDPKRSSNLRRNKARATSLTIRRIPANVLTGTPPTHRLSVPMLRSYLSRIGWIVAR